jgi:hypothetical protein
MTPEQQAIIDKTKARMALSTQRTPEQEAAIARTKAKMGMTPEQEEAIAKTKSKMLVNNSSAYQAIEKLQSAEDAGLTSVADTMQLNILKATPKFMEDGVNNLVSSMRKAKTDIVQASDAMADEISDYSPTDAILRMSAASAGVDIPQPLADADIGELQDADYGKGYSKADKATRRQMRDLSRANNYKNIEGTSSPSVAGDILGSILSPTTVLPLGSGFKAAAAGGGVMAGGYNALEQVARDDESFKKDELAINTAVGATLGVALEGVVQGVLKGANWYRDRGLPVPEEDVAKVLMTNGIDLQNQPVDVAGLTNNVNRYLKENPAPGKIVADIKINENLDGLTEISASDLEFQIKTTVDENFPIYTKPDVTTVSTGPVQPARGMSTPKEVAPVINTKDIEMKVNQLSRDIEDLKAKAKDTTNADYRKRVVGAIKEKTSELDLLKNPVKPKDPARVLPKTKSKKLTTRKQEAIYKTPIDLTDNGYMSSKKVTVIEKEIAKDIKKDLTELKYGWRGEFPKQEQRVTSGRRGTDRPGGRRGEDTPEAKTFSESFVGPRRPEGTSQKAFLAKLNAKNGTNFKTFEQYKKSVQRKEPDTRDYSDVGLGSIRSSDVFEFPEGYLKDKTYPRSRGTGQRRRDNESFAQELFDEALARPKEVVAKMKKDLKTLREKLLMSRESDNLDLEDMFDSSIPSLEKGENKDASAWMHRDIEKFMSENFGVFRGDGEYERLVKHVLGRDSERNADRAWERAYNAKKNLDPESNKSKYDRTTDDFYWELENKDVREQTAQKARDAKNDSPVVERARADNVDRIANAKSKLQEMRNRSQQRRVDRATTSSDVRRDILADEEGDLSRYNEKPVESVTGASRGILAPTTTSLVYQHNIAGLVNSEIAQTIPKATIAKYTNSFFKNPLVDKAVAQAEAIKNLDIPLNSPAGEMINPAIGLSSVQNQVGFAQKFLNAFKGRSAPMTKLRTMGKAGELGADLMERAQREFTTVRDTKLISVLEFFSKKNLDMTGKDGDIVQKILDGKTDEVLGEATQSHIDAAKFVREEIYNFMSREARDSGKWTPAQYAEYMKNPNYFNRSYDFELLRTPEGKKAFIEDLTNLELTGEDSARGIISSIITDDEKLLKESIERLVKLESGRYKINPALAEVLFNKIGARGIAGRATNLDHTRKLPAVLDTVLDKYRKQGLGPNLIAYFNNNYMDVMLAKKFGADDRYAKLIANKIRQQTGREDMGKYFEQVFYEVARDPRSENLQKFMNLSDNSRWALQKTNTVMVASLYKASVANIGQGPANGAVFLSGLDHGSFIKNVTKPITMTIANTARGWAGKFGHQALNEEFMRSGSAFETTLVELLGDAHSHYNKLYNTRRKGSALNPIDWINDPTVFLQVTGFNFSEDINRRVATNMGKAYAEATIARKVKLSKLKTPGAAQQMEIDRVNKSLVEIGLDPNKPEYTVDDMRSVANYFNTQINFTTSPGHAPMWMKSPIGGIIGKFKDFMFKQTDFIETRVLSPLLKKGDARPLLAYAAAAGVVGAPLDALSNLIRGDDTDYTMTQRWARGFAAIGGFAMYGVMLGLFSGDSREALRAVTGPVVGKGADLAGGLGKSISRGSAKPATAAMLETFTPIIKATPQGRELLKDLKKKPKASPWATGNATQLSTLDYMLGRKEKEKKGAYDPDY